MTSGWIKPLFMLAALYDGILGVAILFFAMPLFDLFGVEPVNHVGYVQFPALLLLIFAALFARIARDPAGQRSLIPYGIGLKTSYSALVFWHQLAGGVPAMWIPWAWADLVFLVLFVIAWRQLAPGAASAATR
jgi:hypothetical protein